MSYPQTLWRLLPSFKPAEVVIVKKENSFDQKFLISDSGKWLRLNEVHPTKAAAIAAGHEALAAQEAHIAKLQAGISKKRAALVKAGGEL